MAEFPLLLDRCRLGISLSDDNPPQLIAELSRHFLIRGHAQVITEADLRIRVSRREKDTPAVIGHFDVIKMGPPARFDADGCAQVYFFLLIPLRPHLPPPVQVIGEPFLQCTLQASILREIYIIWDTVVEIHISFQFSVFSSKCFSS